MTDGSSYSDYDYIFFEIKYAQIAPVISVPPSNDSHELGEGAVAFAMTATDLNSDLLTISFSSGNTLLDACCSVSNAGGDNYNVDCNCSNDSIPTGPITVTLIANDGT